LNFQDRGDILLEERLGGAAEPGIKEKFDFRIM